MGKVKEDIKNKTFANMYLLYGEEAFLRNYYKRALVNALVEPEDNLNYSYFEGNKTDINEVVDLINTMPFMNDHRVVLCENTGWFAKEKDADGESGNLAMLTDALKAIAEDVVFIVCEEKIDKKFALYKLINQEGVAEEFPKESDETLARWAMGYCNNAGKKMSPSTAGYFISEAGNDMTLLSLELEKLIAWCLDRQEITSKDIDEVCTHQVNNKIFDMITAISNGQQKQALKLYYDLLTLRESGFHILSLLIRQYNNLLMVRDGMDKGLGARAISDKTKIQDWLVKRLQDAARKMNYSDLVNSLEACINAEQDIKSGKLTETLSIELLIISLSNRLKVQ